MIHIMHVLCIGNTRVTKDNFPLSLNVDMDNKVILLLFIFIIYFYFIIIIISDTEVPTSDHRQKGRSASESPADMLQVLGTLVSKQY